MSILGNRVLGGAGQQPYLVGRSLRFRSSASAYLNRTPASASNRTTWTWSGWVKRGLLTTTSKGLFSAVSGLETLDIVFEGNTGATADTLRFVYYTGSALNGNLVSTPVYRDPSAWYHIVAVWNTTDATSSNRMRLYVNGVEVTAFGTASYPTQNTSALVNNTVSHTIGRYSSTTNYFDGYLAEVNFIDGQALTPSSFGAYDNNGVWQPIKYGGTYGTNGFYLPFSNTTSTTTLTADASGNGNNWTANNISLVTGTGRYLGSVYGSIDTGNGGPPSSMFKGSVGSTSVGSNSVYPNPGATLTWNPYASVPFTSTARVYLGVDLNGPSTGLVVNSTNFGAGGVANNSFGWVNVASAGSPITTMSWTRASGGSQGQRIFAIEIDGVILADSPSWNPLYDSMTDSPTLSASSSNYAVLNPVLQNSWWAAPSRGTIQDGNLTYATGVSTEAFANFDFTTIGKWYFEVTCAATDSSNSIVFGALSRSTFEVDYYQNGNKQINGGGATAYGATWTSGDIIGVAVDVLNNQITFYKNNVSQGAIINTFPTNQPVYVGVYGNSASGNYYFNFGQQPFNYTPPSGYKALNTQNLPQPTIMNGATVMAATTYTGDGTTSRTILAGLTPDMVWNKSRSSVENHAIEDSVRGNGLWLSPNQTIAEQSWSNVGPTTNGFIVSNVGSSPNRIWNDNGLTYVAWSWKAGSGVTSTNTNGSISSLVSVNPTAGFSIVSYTGTGAVATVGHGLGVAPNMIIWKNRAVGTENWVVYHSSLGATGNVYLNLTNGFSTDSTTQNNTAPTSSVFTVATSGAVNGSTRNIIAYCWSAIAGYSSFGSYSGNGSSDGVYIYLGFRPRFVMVKNTTAGTPQSWWIQDSSRSTYNVVDAYLQPNRDETEKSIYAQVDFLSNGIKFRTSDNFANGSGQSYIYAAFAENPFKVSRAR